MLTFIFISVISSSLIPVHAQTIVAGKCDKPVEQNFELEKYLGVWYEIQRTPFFQEAGATCVSASYSAIGNGSIEVVNCQITQKGQYRSIKGNANLQNPSRNEAKLLVNFPSVGASNGTYWVLETDYTKYSIVWSCKETSPSNTSQVLWFLARETNPSQEIREKVRNKMTELDLLTNLKLINTDQENCDLIV